MRFSHISDCHLGGWRQPELQNLNLKSFQKAIEESIKAGVDFVLIAGDLFDSAYPPVEILEEAFEQLKKLKDSKINCYYIAGSHDYSASGKTFLTVLEKAGFCKNIFNPEEKSFSKKDLTKTQRTKEKENTKKSEKTIFLNPVLHENIALYGYPGKKAGMEVEELRHIKLQTSPGLFKILALHTTTEEAGGNLPIDTIKEKELPDVEYYALGHLHIEYQKNNFVYSGPTFPNNFQELEELNHGSFYIVNTNPFEITKKEIKLKDVLVIEKEIEDALIATEQLISEISKKDVENKIVLIKLKGQLKKGKISHIDFKAIEDFLKDRKAYCLVKSTSKLETEEPEFNIEIEDMDKLEDEIIKKYKQDNPSKFDNIISTLFNSLSIEKKEDETNTTFESRLEQEMNKVLELKDDN